MKKFLITVFFLRKYNIYVVLLVVLHLFRPIDAQFQCRNKGFLYNNEWIKHSMKLNKII